MQQEEIKKSLKEIAKENEEQGYQKFMELYNKFNESVNKVLKEMLDEDKTGQYGLKDLWNNIKNKFGGNNEKTHS